MTIVCCDMCGRDTKNKSRICRHCTGGWDQLGEHASAASDCWTEWDGESEYDYSEDSLGPKQAEQRAHAVWVSNRNQTRKARSGH